MPPMQVASMSQPSQSHLLVRAQSEQLKADEKKRAREMGVTAISPRLKHRLSGACYHKQMDKPEDGYTH